jgi:hypothetical protein
MGTEEVATSAPAFNGRAPAPMAASGQREENSMLFSLSALTAKVAPSSPSASSASSSSSSKTSASREDSGLIDLKALADGAGSSGSANLVPDHAGLFPLGAPLVAAVVAPPPALSVAPPPASKAPIFIGIGIAVAAFAIIGAFFAMKGSPPPPVVATENTAQAAPSVVPPVVEPPPTVAAVVTAAPSASAAAGSKTAKAGTGGPIKAGTGAATPVKTGAGTPATPPPATPKKSSCGCAAGDLMCAMKCSAK